MKRSVRYLLCILALGSMFSTCYYLSYRSALKKLKERERQQELNQLLDAGGRQAEHMFAALVGVAAGGRNGESLQDDPEKEAKNPSDPANEEANASNPMENEAVPADLVKEAKILPETKFLLETFEVTTGDFTVEEKQPDAALVGMTRDQLLDYLKQELEDMPAQEYQKGLYANELITFSENKVIVRKTYDADRVDFLYYLAVKNGEVVVYYSDLKTVYEYTGIRAIDLEEEERLVLLDGLRIQTAEDLFSLLESYSS